MKRQGSLFSPISLGLILFLLLGLGWTLLRSGGMAFSPGAVSAKTLPGINLQGFGAHADFEEQCWRCHQPLKTQQAVLCLDCHTVTADEIDTQTGVHGQIKGVEGCYSCHSEHQGRDFDPALSALPHFDHSTTGFNLIWHQVNFDATPMACSSCHLSNQAGFGLMLESCHDCHTSEDLHFMQHHISDFGRGCLECHDGTDRFTGFDHSQTSFALDGQHALASCAACHNRSRISQAAIQSPAADLFENTPQDCLACHKEPEVHLGMFTSACQDCHNTEAWLPAFMDGEPFNHAVNIPFSLTLHRLDYAGNLITCSSCHTNDIQVGDLQACNTCHASHDEAFMTVHRDLFGTACLDCHDGVDRLSNFEHADLFPLTGRHSEIECQSCHQERVYRGTPEQCSACHSEPPIHAGFFGQKCQYCHTDTAWLPALLQIHLFPLSHGQETEIACLVCHPGSYTEITCYGCHDHQPDLILESHTGYGIQATDLPNCTTCHPSGIRSEHPGATQVGTAP
jgi:hypothetical protein